MKVTKVFIDLAHAYFVEKKYDAFVMSGSSRSSKTYSIMQFLITYCQKNKKKGKDILIARQQYSDLKKTVMKDFFALLQDYGLYKEEDHFKSHPQSYKLFGNMIYFSGLDSGGSHGEEHDVVWINEAFEADQDAFRQLNQRLKEFYIMDYNPCFTEHWILDSVVSREKTWFHHSTFSDNRFCPPRVRDEILAYDPSNPINIKNGTADDYMWQVYGLGIGAQPEGIIFKYINWIDVFPKDLEYFYSMDFGFTNDPHVITKVAIDGKQIYAQELCYEPIDHPQAISEYMDSIGIERFIPIVADSSDRYVSPKYGTIEMVKDLKGYGWNIHKVKKTQDIVYWINKIKEYRLNIVHSVNVRKEQQNYRWKSVNGMPVNMPIDKYNHFWDSLRYSLMFSKLRRRGRFL